MDSFAWLNETNQGNTINEQIKKVYDLTQTIKEQKEKLNELSNKLNLTTEENQQMD